MSTSDLAVKSAYQRKSPELYIEDWETEIQNRLEAMQVFDPNATVNYRADKALGTISYMVGSNLAAQMQISGPLQDKATQIVKYWRSLLGSDMELSASRLTMKMPLESPVGHHFILESRIDDDEEPSRSFALHFDKDQRLVFFTAIYQPQFERDREAESEMSKRTDDIEAKLADLRDGKYDLTEPKPTLLDHEIPGERSIKVERQWVPDYTAKKLRPRLQIKCSYGRQDWVLYMNHRAEFVSCRRCSSNANLVVVPLLEKYWDNSIPNGAPAEERERPQDEKPKIRRVILNNLTGSVSFAPLQGAYARVYDHIKEADKKDLKALQKLLITTSNGSTKEADKKDLKPLITPSDGSPSIESMYDNVRNTVLDRILAYYHIDLIQRYFRNLGLSVLDSYQELNPLDVHLGVTSGDISRTSRYLHESKAVVFPQVEQLGKYCTQARSPHIIYHEFVHAVTDALARLGRGRTTGIDDPHVRQIIQAKAIDEGLADYFACSLAERNGARFAQVGELKGITDETKESLQIKDGVRDLEIPLKTGSTRNDSINDLMATVEKLLSGAEKSFRETGSLNDEASIYELSTHWSRFLWRFRSQVDRDVADMIIANSVFFLTRWSTFGMALQALLTADRLLFGGVNTGALTQDPAFDAFKDWKTTPSEEMKDTSLEVTSA